MAANFNFIAPAYDLLVKIVFGDILWEAQRVHLGVIKSSDEVLIVGGGTGSILKWLPEGCQVTYIENSHKMIAKAKLKGTAEFICADFKAFSMDKKFDIIICPFVLDVFESNELNQVLNKLKQCLKVNGQLIVTDFRNTDHVLHKFLVKTMLFFFRWTANLQTDKLLPIQNRIEASVFIRVSHESFRNGLIFSDLYKIQ